MLDAFFIALFFTFISEIADKTQLVILGLALKYKAAMQVFLGALIAHSFMDGIAILLGYFFGFQIQSNLVKILIGIAFILLGIYSLLKPYIKKHQKEKKKIEGKLPFAVAFLTVLLSEFGDKTQISSGLLAAKYLLPWHIFIGAFFALALAIGLNVFIGAKIAKKIPAKKIKIAASVLFILFGMISLLT
ncbi:TMEM165/GDT1 family protein [Candidatus Woesearchaeota archaeon]|nr:TMEM165/GDT1 family protein [Candidatus Woesearchaeota archaeon]